MLKHLKNKLNLRKSILTSLNFKILSLKQKTKLATLVHQMMVSHHLFLFQDRKDFLLD